MLKTYIKILLFCLLNIFNSLKRSFNYTISFTILITIIYLILIKLIAITYYFLNNYIIGLLFSVKI